MKFLYKEKEYSIDGFLASALMSLVYNINKDWDFVILITGDRMVRVGKSVFAQVVCAYLHYCLDKLKLNKDAYNIHNLFFDNKNMVSSAFKLPQYSILHYDEGREGLAASKAMKSFQQDLMDFFTECGQMNHIFVIVAPDFFELKEDIAVARSECLINVYRSDVKVMRDVFKDGVKYPVVKYERGRFQFFSRNTKAKLYDMYRSMHRKNYGLTKADFIGSFSNQYTLDEDEYKKKKKESLARFQERKDDEKKQAAVRKADVFRDNWILNYRLKHPNVTGVQIAKMLEDDFEYEITSSMVNKIIKGASRKGEE